jgi:hypothetical protein
MHLLTTLDIPLLIICHHPETQQEGEQKPHATERCRGREGWDVLGRVLVLEDVGGHDAHKVGGGHAKAGEDETSALVRDVIVVPDVEQDGGRGGAP